MTNLRLPCPRPLVAHFGHFGDMVMLLPFMRTLNERFQQPVDLLTAGGWTRPLLGSQPGTGTIYWMRSRNDPYWITPEQWRLVDALRRRGAGPVWMCDKAEHTKGRWLLARAGFPPDSVADQADCPRAAHEHTVDRWRRFAQLLPPALEGVQLPGETAGSIVPPRVPSITVLPEWRTDLHRWLAAGGLAGRPLVLVQVGSKSTTRRGRPYQRRSNRKYWPIEHWAQVIAGVAALEPDAELLLMGVPVEAPLNDEILEQAREPRARNVARELPMTRLLALFEHARGMITVDTGPAHAAAAFDYPQVVIFGMEDPIEYEPRSPSGTVIALVGAVDGARSMLGVRPEAVLEAWQRLPRRR
ncbi:MAG: glycosyltransferase family 9 protein [Steroidobacteraceae bacterium]|nr:glycosyltransferase family 9 protein [Steroidobacteraceae bacterium]